MSAPVLPAETATWASPALTDCTAFHMDEPRERRTASDGLADMSTSLAVWRISLTASRAGWRFNRVVSCASSPWSRNPTGRRRPLRKCAAPSMTMAGASSPPMASMERTSDGFMRNPSDDAFNQARAGPWPARAAERRTLPISLQYAS